ncbi:peptidyl-prolyl cis-trans isomerase [Chlamydia trachomatis]|nr:peptidyl-prolyl cis-trans isomerase [Chlamydia trachomatis]
MQSKIDGQSAPLTDTEYEKQMAEVQKASFEAKCSENLASAEEFLKENKEKAGVIELEPNKLQYRVVKEGTGRVLSGKPTALLHYTGSFIDGKVFDSSEKNKEPILLPLTKVIPGFSQGMQGMKEGEVRVLYIHPDLAYGTAGQLPPNSLLIFEVKLIEANDDNVSVTE